MIILDFSGRLYIAVKLDQWMAKTGLIIRWATYVLTRDIGHYQLSGTLTLFCSQLKDWHKVVEVMINPAKTLIKERICV